MEDFAERRVIGGSYEICRKELRNDQVAIKQGGHWVVSGGYIKAAEI